MIRSPFALSLLVFGVPALAQVDLSGTWGPRFHEDQQERIPGPELGDYLGIPLNHAARLFAESWDASRLALPEHQCRVHVSPYIYRGPLEFRSWEERDPETQQLIAIKQYTGTYEQSRTIWMDGRPHPPPYAMHTWMGFSTGKWEGDMLTVTTTHIKEGWILKNGVPESDHTTLVEHFIRHGDYLTHVTIINDPVYLTEPLIRTEDFVLDTNYRGSWLYPCQAAVEVATHPKGAVPMYLPGENPFLKEFTIRHHLPEQAARGGAETMYPEYRLNFSPAARVHSDPPAPHSVDREIHVLPVQGNIYMLVGAGGNVTVQVGKQGVLLVDTMLAPLSDKILAAIGRLSPGKIRYIVNTNADADHTGGNESLRKAGVTVIDANAPGALNLIDAAVGAAIIAHENVLKRMSAPNGVQPPTPFGAWPTETFFGGETSLYFNDEPVRIMSQPAAHTDGDVMVFFRRSDVVTTGDIFNTTSYPAINLQRGGNIQGVIDGLNRIIDIAVPAHEEEGGTLVIPGHGRLCDRSDVVLYRDMVTIIRDRIRALRKKGMTLEQVKAATPTLDYDPQYGTNTEAFVAAVYKSLTP